MGVFDWFRRNKFDDAAKDRLADSIGNVLSIQVAAAGRDTPDLASPRGAKALGYVYGFVDAGLRVIGQDMSDMSVGVPLTYQVLRRVFPGFEQRYLDYIVQSIKSDHNMMAGVMLGGQQYLDWLNGKLHAPMGLARCLIELESDASADGTAAVPTRERDVPKTRRGFAPTIGQYRLDMKTTELSKLVELTPTEKEALKIAVEFENERIYHAPYAQFAGTNWEIVLGAVDRRVYKISALLMLQNRQQRDTMWRNVDTQLRTALGAPANGATAIITWDTEDGNVLLNRTEGGGTYALVLTMTSRAVSGFVRIK